MAFDAASILNIQFKHKPKESMLNAGGIPTHYLEWGQPSAQTVVMLHGFTSHGHCWDFLADSLCEKYRIVAFDLPGHGDSGWSRKGYTVDVYRKELFDCWKELGLKKCTLLGMSLGGMIAMDFASRYPDLIEKLIIVDAGPEIPNASRRDLRVRFFGGKSRFSSPEDAFAYRRS
jgi:pimeloyl-ACP methyl ester carboxylesterase